MQKCNAEKENTVPSWRQKINYQQTLEERSRSRSHIRLRHLRMAPVSVIVSHYTVVGIGYHTAYDLAKRKARVILACRNVEKAEEAAEEIRNETRNQNVVVKMLDLSSLKSVREFASNFVRNESRLDILVNNAGVTGLYNHWRKRFL